MGVENNGIAVVKNFGKPRVTYKGEANADNLSVWMTEVSIPKIGEWTSSHHMSFFSKTNDL